MVSNSVLVRNPPQAPLDLDDASHRKFSQALDKLADKSEEAGRLFKEVRSDRFRLQEKIVGGSDELFVEATFGEALYGEVDDETFAALRSVRKRASKYNDEMTSAREMLIRSVAHVRIGDDETAFHILEKYTNQDVALKPGPMKVMGLIMYANLLMNRATMHAGSVRAEALKTLSDAMAVNLRATVENFISERENSSAMSDALANFYLFVSDFFLDQHRPVDADDIACVAKELFPNNPAVLDRFDAHEVSMYDCLVSGANAFLDYARFESNKAYWKHSVSGGLAGAAVGAAGGGTLGSTMLGAAIMSTLFVAFGKAARGFKAEETRQAFITGHYDGSLGLSAFREGMKLLGTYVFFGGLLPIADFVPHVMLASKDGTNGQLHGLGSAMSYVVSNLMNRGGEFFDYVSAYGLVDGSGQFWHNWVNSSFFAESVNNGAMLPFNDPAGRIFSKHSWESLPPALRTFPTSTSAEIAKSIVLGGTYGYMGVSSLYAFLTMNPTVRSFLKKRLPSGIENWLFPGAFLGTSVAMIASGFQPIQAITFSLFCYLVQHRHVVQGGGQWNVMKPGVWSSLDLSKYMRAGAVQLLYIGPGNAIKPHIVKPDFWNADFSTISQYVMNNIEAHCGMVPFLAALGVIHAFSTGLSVKQTLKAKYAKAYTYEIPANTFKLIAGWTSLIGNVGAALIKEFGLGAIVTQSFREAGGSSVQRDTFRGLISRIDRALVDGNGVTLSTLTQTSDELGDRRFVQLQKDMRANAAEMHKDEYLSSKFMKRELADQLNILADCYFMDEDDRALLSPHLKDEWYRTIIYRGLMDPDTCEPAVKEYLKRLAVVASDVRPDLHYVRRNMIVSTIRAIAGSAHGEYIKQFFTEGRGKDIVQAYCLEKTLEEVLRMKREEGAHAWKWRRVRRWIEKNLHRRELTPEDAFYNAAATAGRRYLFSAPFSGRSLMENGAALSSFLLAASQSNPAFQTFADRTLYEGTIYRFLMTPAKKARKTDEEYRDKVVKPLLYAIGVVAARLGDTRKDVRHNLLVSALLAVHGPHGDVIEEWIEEKEHLLEANGIYGRPSIDGDVKTLFSSYLWDSDSSTDGKIVFPASEWRPLNWSDTKVRVRKGDESKSAEDSRSDVIPNRKPL
jgi:hypothetical protein